ncbi:MAG: WecB/TagA/CpsF family glycosyltransferase [Ferruginibacter sp.]
MNKVNLLNIAVSTGTYNDFINSLINSAKQHKSQYTCVANVHMLIEAYKDKSFSSVIANADVIAPDGKPLSWALQILYGINQVRVAGMDLLPDLLSEAIKQQLSVYFYGGTNDLLTKTKAHINAHYPLLKAVGFNSPPFRKLTDAENEQIISDINKSGAGLVFVILGCPKQEKWMASMLGKINSLMIGVGGALPVMVGMQKRAPKWMQNSGLEWVFRLSLEPKRLFKRYAVTNSIFIYLLAKKYISIKFSRNVDVRAGRSFMSGKL